MRPFAAFPSMLLLTLVKGFLYDLDIEKEKQESNIQIEALKQENRELRDLYHGLSSFGSANVKVDEDSHDTLKQNGILQRVRRAESTSCVCRDGKDGRDGRDGAPGAPGLPGPTGPARTSGKPYGGAVYTRWGRTVCGPKSTLIYKGLAGNSKGGHSGGGTNYQCLPHNPEHNGYYIKNGGRGGWRGSYLSGVEYESESIGIFPNEAQDDNVPCAVCLADTRPSGVMIPAKRTCPIGWHKEYEGYLMSEQLDNKHPSTFECVDALPEYVKGESANTGGGHFYFNRPICNQGIPCPSYYYNRALTCVFCTK